MKLKRQTLKLKILNLLSRDKLSDFDKTQTSKMSKPVTLKSHIESATIDASRPRRNCVLVELVEVDSDNIVSVDGKIYANDEEKLADDPDFRAFYKHPNADGKGTPCIAGTIGWAIGMPPKSGRSYRVEPVGPLYTIGVLSKIDILSLLNQQNRNGNWQNPGSIIIPDVELYNKFRELSYIPDWLKNVSNFAEFMRAMETQYRTLNPEDNVEIDSKILLDSKKAAHTPTPYVMSKPRKDIKKKKTKKSSSEQADSSEEGEVEESSEAEVVAEHRSSSSSSSSEEEKPPRKKMILTKSDASPPKTSEEKKKKDSPSTKENSPKRQKVAEPEAPKPKSKIQEPTKPNPKSAEAAKSSKKEEKKANAPPTPSAKDKKPLAVVSNPVTPIQYQTPKIQLMRTNMVVREVVTDETEKEKFVFDSATDIISSFIVPEKTVEQTKQLIMLMILLEHIALTNAQTPDAPALEIMLPGRVTFDQCNQVEARNLYDMRKELQKYKADVEQAIEDIDKRIDHEEKIYEHIRKFSPKIGLIEYFLDMYTHMKHKFLLMIYQVDVAQNFMVSESYKSFIIEHQMQGNIAWLQKTIRKTIADRTKKAKQAKSSKKQKSKK